MAANIKLDHDEVDLLLALLAKDDNARGFSEIIKYLEDQEYTDESIDTIREKVVESKVTVQLLKNKLGMLYDSFY